MTTITQKIVKNLIEMQDIAYRDFHSRLVPTLDKERIIGVRTPSLRKYAKSIKNDKNIDEFICDLPHYYYEENNLHAFILEQIRDYDKCIFEIERFLPYVDNWATCDGFTPVCFRNNLSFLLNNALNWIKSDKTYTVRYGIVVLMKHYLDEHFDDRFLKAVADVSTVDEYYVYMAQSWYFAEALIKQYDFAISYFLDKKLDRKVHNKAIQKAIESFRISDERKEYLKSLKY